MTVRPPSDAAVALRSLGRRWRGLFAGLDEDESPDALARRAGSGGHSALDFAAHATRSLELLDRALEQVLVSDAPALPSAVGDADQRGWPAIDGPVDEAIDRLVAVAERLADRADHAPAADWRRPATVEGSDVATDALAILWDAVDTSISDLRGAEMTIREVRGRV
jgi:hypothetical protein